ncbi:hypothetical protein J1605_021532 [Eschrichtius robustus]|uniref:gluconokinase n=1 Tax=Eschrichtius robustus TaxID=9764 RepID=A0AB34HF31_ESCRO|nr:hypothetical protein J1605_021532 [Eschrichtius robustus]
MGAESRVGRVWSGKGREGEGKASAWVAGGWGRDEGWGTFGAGSWWGLWGGVRLGRAGSRVAPPPVAGKAEQTGPRRRREGAGLRAMAAPGALLVMGVSGSGKSTVGALLASQLGWKFYDADDYHPEENRMKMGKGIPLNDQVKTKPLNSYTCVVRPD